jgi:hypothetical protein
VIYLGGARGNPAQLGSTVLTTVGPVDGEPDVVLFEVSGLHDGDGADLDHWVKNTASTVIAVVNELRPDLGAIAVDRGAEAAIPIGVSPEDLIEDVQAAVAGTLEDSPAVQSTDGTANGRSTSCASSRKGSPTRRSPTPCS